MSLATARDPVDTIVALLDDTDAADYTGDKPQVFRYDETTSKGRQNEARPALYVVAFGSTNLTRFGVDPAQYGGCATTRHSVQQRWHEIVPGG